MPAGLRDDAPSVQLGGDRLAPLAVLVESEDFAKDRLLLRIFDQLAVLPVPAEGTQTGRRILLMDTELS